MSKIIPDHITSREEAYGWLLRHGYSVDVANEELEHWDAPESDEEPEEEAEEWEDEEEEWEDEEEEEWDEEDDSEEEDEDEDES